MVTCPLCGVLYCPGTFHLCNNSTIIALMARVNALDFRIGDEVERIEGNVAGVEDDAAQARIELGERVDALEQSIKNVNALRIEQRGEHSARLDVLEQATEPDMCGRCGAECDAEPVLCSECCEADEATAVAEAEERGYQRAVREVRGKITTALAESIKREAEAEAEACPERFRFYAGCSCAEQLLLNSVVRMAKQGSGGSSSETGE